MYIIRTGLRNIGPFKTVRAAKMWLGKYDAKLAPYETIFECIDPEIALWNTTTLTGCSTGSMEDGEPNSPSSTTTSKDGPTSTSEHQGSSRSAARK